MALCTVTKMTSAIPGSSGSCWISEKPYMKQLSRVHGVYICAYRRDMHTHACITPVAIQSPSTGSCVSMLSDAIFCLLGSLSTFACKFEFKLACSWIKFHPHAIQGLQIQHLAGHTDELLQRVHICVPRPDAGGQGSGQRFGLKFPWAYIDHCLALSFCRVLRTQ